MAEAARYYPRFDYLRIVLALVVVIGHSGLPMLFEEQGNYAVQVFFALSGWLIGGILLRSKPGDLPRFYFNRAARIWIPYFVAILLLVIASLLKDHVTRKWIEIFFYDITFVYNFFGPPQLAEYANAMPLQGTGNHFWSICAEEQFYLCAPFLITLTGKIGRSLWFWAIASALTIYSDYWVFLASISLGVLSAISVKEFGDWHNQPIAKIGLGLIFVIIFSAVLADLLPYRIGGPLSADALVLLLAIPGKYSSVGAFLGGVSFPLYLNQWIGVFISNWFFGHFNLRESLASRLCGIGASFVVAVFLYLAIDRLVKRYRSTFFTPVLGKVLAATGLLLVVTGVGGYNIIFRHGP